MLEYFQHSTPAYRVFCGDRALDAIPRELDRLRCSRVVVVSGPWILKRPDISDAVKTAIDSRLAGHFIGVEMHSPIPSVEAARTFLEDTEADAVIALGGGSSIVTARAATILLAEGRAPRELSTRRGDDGLLFSPRLSALKLPNWVIPSTPITAYATAGSAIHDPETGERFALYDPKTRAQGIFIDPVVALSAPIGLATSAALHCFSVAVESVQTGNDDPLADALLIHALTMLSEWLPRSQDAPDNAKARLRLMLGALLCGQGGEHVGGGLSQALSHAAGPRSSVANGIVEAMLLPHTMRFNAPVTGNRLEIVADVLRLAPSVASGDHGDAITLVQQVLNRLGIPTRLRDVGISAEALPEIIEHALDDWSITQSPRRVDSEGLAELLGSAW